MENEVTGQPEGDVSEAPKDGSQPQGDGDARPSDAPSEEKQAAE
jgi:hypothetical protein